MQSFIKSSFLLLSQGFTQTSLFCLIFLDLFLLEIIAIGTAAAAYSWLIFGQTLEGWILCTNNFYELCMNNLEDSVNARKCENRLWFIQVVLYKSFNGRPAYEVLVGRKKKVKRWLEKKNGKDEMAKNGKCWTIHSRVERIIYNFTVGKKPIVVASYNLVWSVLSVLVFSLVMSSFISWNIFSKFPEFIRK